MAGKAKPIPDGFDTVTAHLWMRRVLMRKKRQGNTRRTW